jgi:hypothetical protein
MIPPLGPTIFLALKVVTLIGLAVYAVFAVIIVRQEQLMADVLEEGFEPVLRLITLIHLLLAVGLIFLAFIFL